MFLIIDQEGNNEDYIFKFNPKDNFIKPFLRFGADRMGPSRII